MSPTLLALLLAGLLQADAPAGDARAGEEAWQRRPSGSGPNQAAGTLWCNNCHGMNGEGAFGPDLAGRGHTYAQFRRAVRHPWGVMPRYPERTMSDQAVADVHAWLSSLPRVAAPGAWKRPAPAQSPRGPHLMTIVGCYQCHGPGMGNPRRVLGGQFGEVDLALFANVIYNHDEHYPQNQMGLFSRDRLPESTLRQIYQHVFGELGIRVPVTAAMTEAEEAGGRTTFTVTLSNAGDPGVGLTTEAMRIALPVPAGVSVLGGTGAGYQGVQRDPAINGGADAVMWKVPRLVAGDSQTFTVTLAEGVTAAMLKGSLVTWEKPALGPEAGTRHDSVAVRVQAP